MRFPLLPYREAEEQQNRRVAALKTGEGPESLLLLEHPPVVTLGRGADLQHLMVSEEWLSGRQVEVIRTGRGGEITYHGPGQLIAYPILLLEEGRRDLHRYLRDLEQVVLDLLRDYAVSGQRIAGRTGVWTMEPRKIASIGVRASSWVTSHGVALNYGADLSGFEWMRPCGLEDVKMTSLTLEGVCVPRLELEKRFCDHFQRIFGRELF